MGFRLASASSPVSVCSGVAAVVSVLLVGVLGVGAGFGVS